MVRPNGKELCQGGREKNKARMEPLHGMSKKAR